MPRGMEVYPLRKTCLLPKPVERMGKRLVLELRPSVVIRDWTLLRPPGASLFKQADGFCRKRHDASTAALLGEVGHVNDPEDYTSQVDDCLDLPATTDALIG